MKRRKYMGWILLAVVVLGVGIYGIWQTTQEQERVEIEETETVIETEEAVETVVVTPATKPHPGIPSGKQEEVAEEETTKSEAEETVMSTEETVEQEIQPEVVQPSYEEEALNNPEETPDGTPKEEVVESETVAAPSGGLPGFTAVPDGGANTVIQGESDGDINTQVGTME